jgi:hypothetical protein
MDRFVVRIFWLNIVEECNNLVYNKMKRFTQLITSAPDIEPDDKEVSDTVTF